MLKEISIEIIRKCPNNCLHCSSSSNATCTEVLPYEKFQDIVSDAKLLGAQKICLSGGEPLLHPMVTDMVEFVNRLNMSCVIYTSGITISNDGHYDSIPYVLVESLAQFPVRLIFNIEAGTEKTYDKIMGTRNCFYKMQESVRRIVSAGIKVEAHFVPMSLNVNEIEETVNLCERLGVEKVSFLRLVAHGRAEQHRDAIALKDDELTELKKQLISLQNQAHISVRIGVPLSKDYTCSQCEAANGKLNIKYNGEVYPCEVFKNSMCERGLDGLKPDSIYQKSLEEIYNHSPYLCCVRAKSSAFIESGDAETCFGQYLMRDFGEGGY